MKHCLTLISLAFAVSLQAQTFFQDFEVGIEPMVLFNVDGLTPHANVGAYTNAWNRANVTFGNGTFVAISTSWYVPPASADDWMVTPLIHLPDTNGILRWDAKAQDGNFRDGYTVYISTTGNTPADFTTVLYTTAAELATWTTRTVSLDAYSGQAVYIAFRNNSNDKFLLLVDNIFVGAQKQRDISLVRVTSNINFATTAEGSRSLGITIQNFGLEPITSLNVTWNLNGETATQNLTGINISPTASYTFQHDTPVNYIVGEGYQLNVTVDSINGTVDEQPNDNAWASPTFKVLPPVPNFIKTSSDGELIDLHQILASGKVVILDFFASWCGPCVVSTPILNNLYVASGAGEADVDVIGISIEGADTDAIVNSLNWGSTYPNLSFGIQGFEAWINFDFNQGLGAGGLIPFFVVICPNVDDPAYSEIVTSYVGIEQFQNVLDNTWLPAITECVESLSSAVKDIRSIESFTLLPNPTQDYLNVVFSLSEPTEMAMEIIDVTGKSMIRQPVSTFPAGENTERIDVNNFVSGTYFVRLTQQNAVSTLKFTVVN